MDKEFETWWIINKNRLMEDDSVGLREIALAAYLAGKEAAQQIRAADDGDSVPPIYVYSLRDLHTKKAGS